MNGREGSDSLDSPNEHNIPLPTTEWQRSSPWYGEATTISSQTSLFTPELTDVIVPTIETTYDPTSLTSSITTVLETATTLTSSISSSSGTSPQTGDSSSGSSNTKTIAIAVPVSIVGAALLLGALFLLLRRRRRKTRQENPSNLQVDMAQTTRTNLLPHNGSSWNVGHAHSHEIPFEGPYPSQAASTNRVPPTQPYSHEINETSRSQPSTLSVPAAPAGVTESRQPESGFGRPETSPVTAGWQAGSEDRPRSPFDHPLDDAMSEVSGLSDRRGATHSRDLDDISSVSSISDDEHETRR
ncbi:uncharacterized protein CDV56_105759 [Aspergillus thermomutatus]|uniref:Uncharacterized protein n=1 Tax=Aspergillus thermomutatus TaxID=41047 RepID=A0A397GGB9_ASPTH|nr:uncharacterized protein CDV56_105759 [Aspergillus thermomutatus]RHZ50035.1 hypothetical protein CDV56_105759 [Aspergillus thermomutatus]